MNKVRTIFWRRETWVAKDDIERYLAQLTKDIEQTKAVYSIQADVQKAMLGVLESVRNKLL